MTHSHARFLLCVLVILLILEGFIRKLLPDPFSDYFLFFKDILILFLIPYVMRLPQNDIMGKIFYAYITLLVLLLPLVLLTASHDPVLALFGFKQYALYPWVALAWPRAFLAGDTHQWKIPYRILGFSLFLTLPVALFQISLPSTHWLNLGVGGGDLSGFAAGGVQRVSSTFSFIAQYNFYLLLLPAPLAICHLWRKDGPFNSIAFSLLLITAFYIVSVFITGSRTSVLGSLAILTIALLLFLRKARRSLFPKVIALGIALYLGFNIATALFPQAFVAYTERTRDQGPQTHTQEVIERMVDSYTLWWERLLPRAGFTGLGLGTMSNGVQQLSQYAAHIRETTPWGETDLANTMLEGGIYLVLVWKGFRFYIIYCCWQIFRRTQSSYAILPGAFFLSHIVVEGVNGTLAIQPPEAIWFWISVGSLLLLLGKDLQKKRIRGDHHAPASHISKDLTTE